MTHPDHQPPTAHRREDHDEPRTFHLEATRPAKSQETPGSSTDVVEILRSFQEADAARRPAGERPFELTTPHGYQGAKAISAYLDHYPGKYDPQAEFARDYIGTFNNLHDFVDAVFAGHLQQARAALDGPLDHALRWNFPKLWEIVSPHLSLIPDGGHCHFFHRQPVPTFPPAPRDAANAEHHEQEDTDDNSGDLADAIQAYINHYNIRPGEHPGLRIAGLYIGTYTSHKEFEDDLYDQHLARLDFTQNRSKRVVEYNHLHEYQQALATCTGIPDGRKIHYFLNQTPTTAASRDQTNQQ